MKIKIPILESSSKGVIGVTAIAATSEAATDTALMGKYGAAALREIAFQAIKEVREEIPDVWISSALSEQSMDSPYIYLVKINAETGVRLVHALSTFEYKVKKKIEAVREDLEITTISIPI